MKHIMSITTKKRDGAHMKAKNLIVGILSAATIATLAASAQDHNKMPGRDHSKMPGMDHRKMPGMDHSKMPGMDHSKMPGMDHSKMPGMDHSKMPGMDHSKMQHRAKNTRENRDLRLRPKKNLSHVVITRPVPVVTPDIAHLPWTMENGVKVFHLTAEIVKREILPGSGMGPAKVLTVWGYNGSVPGPTIEVNEGDRVRIVFHNNLPEDTTVHWHGLEIPIKMD